MGICTNNNFSVHFKEFYMLWDSICI